MRQSPCDPVCDCVGKLRFQCYFSQLSLLTGLCKSPVFFQDLLENGEGDLLAEPHILCEMNCVLGTFAKPAFSLVRAV